MAPDGNGGVYASLYLGCLGKMTSLEASKTICMFSSDNALINQLTCLYWILFWRRGADCGNKVVWSPCTFEWSFASKAGKACIVEYSELRLKWPTN
jgi:hypothetical protein